MRRNAKPRSALEGSRPSAQGPFLTALGWLLRHAARDGPRAEPLAVARTAAQLPIARRCHLGVIGTSARHAGKPLALPRHLARLQRKRVAPAADLPRPRPRRSCSPAMAHCGAFATAPGLTRRHLVAHAAAVSYHVR